MSIIISNISEEKGIPYSREGKQIYRVQMNHVPLVEFEHTSEMGMDICLLKAANALRNVDIDEKVKLYEKEQFRKFVRLLAENDVLKTGGLD